MNYLPRAPGAATAFHPDAPLAGPRGGAADWSDLADELDRWGDAGKIATLWWRDDDAAAATPELEALLRLSARLPLALAVIPAAATPGLGEVVAGHPGVAVLQHGWRHANHSRQGKKSEYPAGRCPAEVTREITAGRSRLVSLFGPRALPVFVPPWNRLGADLLPLLPQAGIAAISAMRSRDAGSPLPGLATVDVHVDPVAWRSGGGFVGEPIALGAVVSELRARRTGTEAVARPIGLLTHHLVTNGPIAAFIERLIAVTGGHPAVRWTGIAGLLR